MRIAAVAAVLFVCACGGGQDPSSSDDQNPMLQEQLEPPAVAANSSNGTVTICHIPPGNPAKAHTITVGAPAARAHIANHGDRVGGCCVEAGVPCTTGSDCCQDQAALVCRVDPSSPTGRSCGGIG